MFGLIAFACGLAMYFMPAIIAHHRRHLSSGAILLLNLLLGWSIIGWIVCFAWACSGATRHDAVVLPNSYRR